MTRHSPLAGLIARFDSLALRPPAASAMEARLQADRPAPWQALADWCGAGGAGQGTSRHKLAVAQLDGADAAACQRWVNAFARQLDGSSRLDALPGRAPGLAWRLQTKLLDTLAWRARRFDDPWDAGWALSTPAALDRWAAHFVPRRPTLVLADLADQPALQAGLAALALRSPDWAHPVRWLWVGRHPSSAGLQGAALPRFRL